MISHIDIKNFAVIKELSLDLFPGLNIITGETGAGKSVVIEAISMALGARADTDYIRNGCDKALISMLVTDGDKEYLLKREISQGKSLCRINGEMVSLGELSSVCSGLVDIHGQYDHQSLLNPDNHLALLDLYGGDDLKSIKADVEACYKKYAETSGKLMNLRKKLSDSARQKDFLKFEAEEISSAKLKSGEDEELEEKIKLMENSEDIFEAMSFAHSRVFDSDNSAYSSLGDAISKIESIKDLSEEYKEIYGRLCNAYYELEDINSEIRRQREAVSFSQSELDDAIDRLNLINKLKKKYGGSIEAVLDYLQEAQNNLSSIENGDEEMAALEKELLNLKKTYDIGAEKLSTARHKAASFLSERINKELFELNFSNAQFSACFSSCTPGSNGNESCEFLISANKGEAPKPLAKVASGGELSRIMLALKRIIGDLDGIPTMIFDEIDSGISGATAGIVGEKLESIASNHQIICITHLPQIASKGENHFKITKTSDETSTMTDVVLLNKDERIEELARLLSGTEITDSARAQAKELLIK